MTDEENNKRSAEIEKVKEKLYVVSEYYLSLKEVKGLLNTITALSYRWGLKKGYDEGYIKAKEGKTCRSCEQWTTCNFTDEGKCEEYKRRKL